MSCLFCKLVGGEVPAAIIYQDDKVMAFNDIHPRAPVHILVIPKQHIATLNALNDPALAGHLLLTAKRLATEAGLGDDGYRTVINCNKNGGQEVLHLHLHVLGGRAMTWPPG